MADIKTHLRELSVAVGIGIKKNRDLPNNLALTKPKDFFNLAYLIVNNDISSARNILEIPVFTPEHHQIIKNGLKLADIIVKIFNVGPSDRIIWLGSDTQKNDPIDLIVGNIGFSLKEESYILENMGLYKYLNLMTGSSFSRGLHVFEYFSPQEYNNWFQYTWNRLLNIPGGYWETNNGRYHSSIHVTDNKVTLNYNNTDIKILPTSPITIADFQQSTNSVVREKVFSKWINETLRTDTAYLSVKNQCSIVAGENLCRYVIDNLNPMNLARLLQIYEIEYYYAKSTSNELKILKVPRRDDFSNEIEVANVEYSVPSSQLNILTTIRNKQTGRYLTIRNECRFSHGQFNGTPEAKMYYEHGNDLSVIYTPIYEK
ncbi:MAG: hypothetical protein QHH06_09975 [Clostridiales bacterium]|jgi:hypothetical protein|nr:hypothetical protein [Eubacteriales bacterium]MDH7566792.1 hypothetical protein [Clostridiales bacterium]